MTTGRPDQPRALITGAGKRIGQSVARGLAEAGWDVALHHKDSHEGARAVAVEAQSKGRKAITIEADLSDPTVAQSLVETAADRLGPLSLLVNNASTHEKDSLATLTLDSWRRLVDINLTAQVFLMQAFARQQPVPEGASIVNLLDQQITAPSPAWFSYFVAKIGLEGATRLAAFELAPDIRVNAVAPGLVLPSAGQTADAFRVRQGIMPLGAGLEPRDVAEAVLYLAGARHVTGQVIYVDSGQRLIGTGNTRLGMPRDRGLG